MPLDAAGGRSSSPIAFVAMRIDGDDAEGVCREIGRAVRTPTADTLAKAGSIGCARNGDRYAAYARVD